MSRQSSEKAGIANLPEAATAVFVGTEFDAVKGRGGNDGTPLRKTPWGEIAFQLGGEKSFAAVAQHDKEYLEPKGDVIREFLPKDKPCLILMDEIINYVSSYRKKGYANAFYNFIQALSETARGQGNVVLVVSLPASELEYTPDDEQDEVRFKKMLDRLGKAVMMSAESETSEIIRRRLFDWDESERDLSGKIHLGKDAVKTCEAYADWIKDHRQQIPDWFPTDHAMGTFQATYPFHPSVLSVFERKWQALSRFQRTRGVLRLLALWVSKNYKEGYQKGHKEPLIGLGSAPLYDPMFRSAAFEQMGENKLEIPVVTDVCGRADSHAVRLDKEAVDTIRKAALHKRTATTIFFESNGGQTRENATLPEVRLAVGAPDLDIGNVETVLEGLGSDCYYLTIQKNQYRFSLSPNLNKLLADRRANIKDEAIDERVRSAILKEFPSAGGVSIHPFPSPTNSIPDRPSLTFVILAPDQLPEDPAGLDKMVDSMTREHGASARTFKSALIWCVPDSNHALREEARKALAWEDIRDNDEERLDETQRKQLKKNIADAPTQIKEAVWRSYRYLMLLGRDNRMMKVDLGFVHSSQAKTMVELVLNRLRKDGEVERDINPAFLVRNWPPAFTEWSTKALRDAFFASPKFPRLLDGDAIKVTVAAGVSNGILAYVGKTKSGKYEPFRFDTFLEPSDVEICDDMFIITADEAKRHIEPKRIATVEVSPPAVSLKPGESQVFSLTCFDQNHQPIQPTEVAWEATGGAIDENGRFVAGETVGTVSITAYGGDIKGVAVVHVAKEDTTPPPPPPRPGGIRELKWSGEVPPRKWTNFYSKVLSKYSAGEGLRLYVNVAITPEEGISKQKVEETKQALRELGLNDEVECEGEGQG